MISVFGPKPGNRIFLVESGKDFAASLNDFQVLTDFDERFNRFFKMIF